MNERATYEPDASENHGGAASPAESAAHNDPAAAPVIEPERITPTPESQRYLFLDFLRGVALLGILPENLPYMAWPVTADDPTGWSWQNSLAFYVIQFVGDYKFMTLFALMFGIGLALIHQRCVRAERGFYPLYLRRIVLLGIIGVAHATLLWWGDILFYYAVGGFLAMWSVRWTSRKLRRTGITLICVPAIVMAVTGLLVLIVSSTPSLRETEFGKRIEKWDQPEEYPSLPDDFDQLSFSEQLKYFGPDMETVYYRDGSFAEVTVVRTVVWMFGFAFLGLYMEWRVIGLFMIGMALLKDGWFLQPEQHKSRFNRLIRVGLIFGLPLQIAAVFARYYTHEIPAGSTFAECLQYTGSLGMAAAYAGIIALIYIRCRQSRLIRAFAAVGRTALTSYITQSLIGSLIFYSYGLAQFGRWNRLELWWIVLAIWAVQLALAPLWLRYFKFGPLEWLWRSATYLRPAPILRHS
jgi:uncharacterized protein